MADLPLSPHVSAFEALAFIAYGAFDALENPVLGEAEFLDRCGFEMPGSGSTVFEAGRHSHPLHSIRYVLAHEWHARRGYALSLRPLPASKENFALECIRRWGGDARAVVREMRELVGQIARRRRQRELDIEVAARRLKEAILDQRILEVYGRRGTANSNSFTGAEHDPVPTKHFRNALRRIREDGWTVLVEPNESMSEQWWVWAHSYGEDWGDLQFSRQALLDCWHHETAPSAVALVEAPPKAQPKINRGGRPETHAWRPFRHEISRILALDGGYLTCTEFRRSMKLWAGEHMDPCPDEKTIRKQIDDFVDTSILQQA